jgi:hypothetical protein
MNTRGAEHRNIKFSFKSNKFYYKQQSCEIFVEMMLKYITKGAEHRNINFREEWIFSDQYWKFNVSRQSDHKNGQSMRTPPYQGLSH